jgi:hypothetical protein
VVAEPVHSRTVSRRRYNCRHTNETPSQPLSYHS